MATFGENLRRERELRGITLLELANATKVSARHLEALERNQFDRLPGGVFTRGFVRAVARYMKLDENYWVGEYARTTGEEPEIVARYAPATSPPPSSTQRGKWGFVALVLVFAAGAYLVHDARLRRAAEASPPVVAPPRVASPAAALPTPAVVTPALATTSASAPAAPTTAAAPPSSPSPGESPDELRLQVDVVEAVWVRVAVDDQTRYEGWMKPGQPRRFRGVQRIELTADNASAVVLTLNGETLPPLGSPGERKNVVLTAKDLKTATP